MASPALHHDVPLSSLTTRKRQAARELIKRKDAREDIEAYRQYISKSGHLDFQYWPAEHHQLMQAHLQALIDGDLRRLMIFLPPGAAKSTYSSIQAATYFLARNPMSNILACSNTQDLAENFNRRRRAVLETDQWQEVAQTRLDQNMKGVARFATEHGGNCIAAGAGSSITGLRSHFNIADDLIIGHEQASSPTQLDKLWQWWMSDFRSRLLPRCPELIIMTRWSTGDVAGRILNSKEAKTWTVLRIPMECDDEATDPLHRKTGDLLWDDWYEPERIEEFKRNPRDWISLFQQRPTDEAGQWMPPEHYHLEVAPPASLNYVIGVDIALSVGTGDFTVIAVVGIDQDKHMHLVDLYRAQVDPETAADKFLELCQTYNPTRAMIDDDNASKVFHRYVFDRARQSHYAPPLQLRPMRGQNKEVRAAALRGYLLGDRVFVREASWSPLVYEEFLNFPSQTVHDDIVDAMGLVAREMVSQSAPVPPTPAKQLDLGEPIIEKDGVQHLNVPLNDLLQNHDDDRVSLSRIYKGDWH